MHAVRSIAAVALLGAALLVTAPAPQAASATYYVDAVNGTDTAAGGTLGSPWRTLTYALGQVSGTPALPVFLLVAEGTYTGTVTLEPYVEIDGGHQPFTWVRDPAVYRSVLEGAGADHVVVGANSAVLDGFTVRGGVADGAGDGANGGGIFCDATSPTISNNVIASNHATVRGGGLYVRNASPVISGNVFVGNTVPDGAPTNEGAAAYFAFNGAQTPVLSGNLFTDNRGYWRTLSFDGAAGTPATVTFTGNRYVGNTAGTHVQVSRVTGTWTNNEFLGNLDNAVFGGGPTGNLLNFDLTPAGTRLVNNTLAGPATNGLRLASSNTLSCANNILTGYTNAVFENDLNADALLDHNLFFANSVDVHDEDAINITGATNINTLVAGAVGNVTGNPLLVTGLSHASTAAAAYDASTHTTTLTDALGTGGGGNALAGWYVNPDIAQQRVFVVKQSTATTLVVWGNASAIAQNGDTYNLRTLRLQAGSAALNAGSPTAPGLPPVDRDGEPRPGADGQVDIGADEFDDTDGDGRSDGLDNCPAVSNPTQTDTDGDGFGDPCDCAPADADVHPGAPEVNDGEDNQCPGAPGYGFIDEIEGATGFFNALNPNAYSWTPQPGATMYQIAQAGAKNFSTGCQTFVVSGPPFIASDIPPAGQGHFYLVRALLPFPGSWGWNSAGVERSFVCGSETSCTNGVDDDLDGTTDCHDPDCGPDAACVTGCAAGSVRQDFDNGMYGCSGVVTWPARASLCTGNSSVCGGRAWVDSRAGLAPTHNYWTNDPLRYNGSGPGNCSVSPTSGSTCSPGTPMRVCAASVDPLGNTCNWTACGWETTTPSESFGGCEGNTTAGTLCCDKAREQTCNDHIDDDADGLVDCFDPECAGSPACAACAPGITPQLFEDGMVGCPGSVDWANRATLCGAGSVVCSAQRWVDDRGGGLPAAHYWTNDDLRYNGTSAACWVSIGTGSPCPAGQPMRVCDPDGIDPLGNACNWLNCGWNVVPPNQYFGGCSGNITAGTLCCLP